MFQQRVAIRMNFLNHVNIMEHAFWFPVSKPGLENWISEKTGIQTHICLSPKPGLYTCSIPAFPGKELAGTGQGWAPGNWVHGQRQHGKKMSGKWGCSEPDLVQESIWRVQQGWKEALETAAGWPGVEGVVQEEIWVWIVVPFIGVGDTGWQCWRGWAGVMNSTLDLCCLRC